MNRDLPGDQEAVRVRARCVAQGAIRAAAGARRRRCAPRSGRLLNRRLPQTRTGYTQT